MARKPSDPQCSLLRHAEATGPASWKDLCMVAGSRTVGACVRAGWLSPKPPVSRLHWVYEITPEGRAALEAPQTKEG